MATASRIAGVCYRPDEHCAVLGCSQFRVGVEKRFNPAKVLLQDVASQNGEVGKDVSKDFSPSCPS